MARAFHAFVWVKYTTAALARVSPMAGGRIKEWRNGFCLRSERNSALWQRGMETGRDEGLINGLSVSSLAGRII